MLTDLIELGQKMKKQMKDTQNEIKQNIQRTNSDMKETRTQSNNLEQKRKNKHPTRQDEETRIPKIKESLTNFWDNLKHLLIMLLQLFRFSPFASLQPSPLIHSGNPPTIVHVHGSCVLVLWLLHLLYYTLHPMAIM